MASGTHLSGFNDFVEATGPVYLTGPKSIVNEAQLNTYSFSSLTMGDRGKKKMIQGGETIRESIVFDSNGTAKFHKPGATQNWVNPQNLKKIQARWRFMIAHMAWTRQEIMLNDRMSYGNADTRYQQYVDLLYEKEMMMWTDKWNLVESHLWAAGDPTEMEDEAGVQPYSIPYFVNEDTNGLFNPRASAVATTVEGIDPTATGFTKFVPKTRVYTNEAINNTAGTNNIIDAFDLMWKDVRFEMPPTYQEYFTSPKYNKQCIYTSGAGHTAYGRLIRQHSTEGFHNIAGAQDPAIPDPQYKGIPIRWVASLDTAPLYNSGSSTVVAEGTANVVGPRFYWLNAEFLYPVFHSEMYFEKDEVTRDHNDPDSFVCPVATWYNVVCTSRQRLGIVSPAVSLYTQLY